MLIHSCTIFYTFYSIKMHYHYVTSLYLQNSFHDSRKIKSSFEPTWELSGTIKKIGKILFTGFQNTGNWSL